MGRSFPQRSLDLLARFVEAEMTDHCVIEAQAQGPGSFDPDTGLVTIQRTVVYDGPCYFGDRVEGAFASGGFGGNAQEWAFDSRSANCYLRLPLAAPAIPVGAILTINGETHRITGTERGTQRADATYRSVRYDPDASRA